MIRSKASLPSNFTPSVDKVRLSRARDIRVTPHVFSAARQISVPVRHGHGARKVALHYKRKKDDNLRKEKTFGNNIPKSVIEMKTSNSHVSDVI